MKSHGDLWEICKLYISAQVQPNLFKVWFEPIESLSYEDGVLTLAVPSESFAKQLENRYFTILKTSINHVYGSDFKTLYYKLHKND